jgi:UDP-glucuronate decarboxylase
MTVSNGRIGRVLVTGGAGFLGSHLCDRLINDGHDVVCLDNLCTGSRRNVDHLINHPRFNFVEHDICTPFQAAVAGIVNLACPASPVHYQEDPIQTIKTVVLGAMHMLDLADRLGCPIVQASTSEVYGDPNVHPQNETYRGNVNPNGPRACYDESKRCAETLFCDYHRMHGVKIRIARIFNTYGPRMAENDGRVVSNFILQALQDQQITVFGEGEQTRSFCYVDDTIDGLARLLHAPPSCTQPINLGNPVETRVIDLAKMVIDATKSASTLDMLDLPEDDPTKRKPDISRAEDLLNWSPKVTLNDGLARTIEYFENVIADRHKAADVEEAMA